MRAFLFALALAMLAAPAAAQDAPSARPLVVVVDPGPARINAERLRRTLEATLRREVVRITDERANDAAGTLTLARASEARWLVRFEGARSSSSAATASTFAEISRPGLYDVVLAGAARRVVDEAEAATPQPPSAAAQPSPSDAEDRARVAASAGEYTIGWADEILDPFENLPPLPRREIASATEVIDPFAPLTARRAFSEVLDPWGQ